MKRLACGLVAAAALQATAAAPVAPADGVTLRVPAIVAWSGVPAAAGDGTTAQMLYPAPTPLLGLVAVLTHGALLGGARAAEESRRQKEADRALDAYRPALSDWSPRALLDAALEQPGLPAVRVADDAGSAGGASRWVVESTPSFSMFPDQTRLLLDNRVRMVDAGNPAAAPFELLLRVLSNPRGEAGAFPVDDGAALLKQESARLFAHSIDLALQVGRRSRGEAADEPPFRTHRYLDGALEGMERGQLVGSGCARIVIRTLRGALLSAPVRAAADADAARAAACAAQPYRVAADGS